MFLSEKEDLTFQLHSDVAHSRFPAYIPQLICLEPRATLDNQIDCHSPSHEAQRRSHREDWNSENTSKLIIVAGLEGAF